MRLPLYPLRKVDKANGGRLCVHESFMGKNVMYPRPIAGFKKANVVVVYFSDNADIRAGPLPLDQIDTTELRYDEPSGGGTNIKGAVNMCTEQLTNGKYMKGSGHAKVIVLLTDGEPDPPDVGTLGSATAAKGPPANAIIFTVGMGPLLNAEAKQLLQDMSSGDGFYFASNAFDNSATDIAVQIVPTLCQRKGQMLAAAQSL